jgi:hypothetical protein
VYGERLLKASYADDEIEAEDAAPIPQAMASLE